MGVTYSWSSLFPMRYATVKVEQHLHFEKTKLGQYTLKYQHHGMEGHTSYITDLLVTYIRREKPCEIKHDHRWKHNLEINNFSSANLAFYIESIEWLVTWLGYVLEGFSLLLFCVFFIYFLLFYNFHNLHVHMFEFEVWIRL